MEKRHILKSSIQIIVLLGCFFGFIAKVQAGKPISLGYEQQARQRWKGLYQLRREKDLALRLDGLQLFQENLERALDKGNLDTQQMAETNQVLYLVLQAQAKYPQAKIAFGQYIDLLRQSKGDDYSFAVIRGNSDTLVRRGDIDRAKLYIEKGLDCFSNHPKKNELYLVAGKYYQRVKNWPKSGFYLQKIMDSRDEPDRKVQLAMVHMVSVLMHEDKYDEAHLMLDRLVEIDSSWAAYAEAQKGGLYLDKGLYVDALFQFNKVKSEYPGSRYAGLIQGDLDYIKETIMGNVPENK